jgi:hypothetical protein
MPRWLFLHSRVGQMQASSQAAANQLISDLRQKRDAFGRAVGNQTATSEGAWTGIKAQLDAQWQAFEAQLGKHIESAGRNLQQQQDIFHSLAAAQMKAWRDAADSFVAVAGEFASESRAKIATSATQMKAAATVAEQKLQSLGRVGTEPWSLLNAALSETRAAFDRSNQMAQDAIQQAMRSK